MILTKPKKTVPNMSKGANNSYWGNIWEGLKSALQGLALSFKHLKDARRMHSPTNVMAAQYFKEDKGIVTLQYPYEAIPLPDTSRYRLYNEIEDCIVCDKCAKVCPVDCIEIEAIKATEQVGTASDGSPIRLYASKFDIDMAKCCYCGLCTTVCPTECLTMTKVYDYSEFDVTAMYYHFSNLSPEEAEQKKQLLEQFQREKEALKTTPTTTASPDKATAIEANNLTKPKFIPKAKPKNNNENQEKEVKNEENTSNDSAKTPNTNTENPKLKPKFIPKAKPKNNNENQEKEVKKEENTSNDSTETPDINTENPKLKPKFIPKAKPKKED